MYMASLRSSRTFKVVTFNTRPPTRSNLFDLHDSSLRMKTPMDNGDLNHRPASYEPCLTFQVPSPNQGVTFDISSSRKRGRIRPLKVVSEKVVASTWAYDMAAMEGGKPTTVTNLILN